MKIRNTDVQTKIGELEPGQVFYYYRYKDNCYRNKENSKLYMLAQLYMVAEGLEDEPDSPRLYAVELENGIIERFKEDQVVYAVEGEFVF